MVKVFNEVLFEERKIHQMQIEFASALPFKNICIDNFLDDELADKLCESFPPLETMKKQYNGLNEKKAEDSDSVNINSNFRLLKESLHAKPFINLVERITGIKNLITANDKRGYGMHQGGKGSFLDVHIDFNIHPLLNIHRRLNLIIFLNKNWEEEWGGHLEFWNKDVTQCIQRHLPIHNRCIIFETNEISFHGYSKISVPTGVSRKSFYNYYYTTIAQPINYHDTIFKTRPDETLFKNVATRFKDFIKNSTKKSLKKIGIGIYFKKIE